MHYQRNQPRCANSFPLDEAGDQSIISKNHGRWSKIFGQVCGSKVCKNGELQGPQDGESRGPLQAGSKAWRVCSRRPEKQNTPPTRSGSTAQKEKMSGKMRKEATIPSDDLRQEAEDFLHRCDRSARYHKARRAFFERLDQLAMVIVLFSSSGTAALFLTKFEAEGATWWWPFVLSAVPAFFSAVVVVARPAAKAYDHEILASRFYQLYRSINVDHVTRERLFEWDREILKIYESEPPVYHAVNAEAYNAATQARGFGPDRFLKIGWLQRLTGHFIRYSVEKFPPLAHC